MGGCGYSYATSRNNKLLNSENPDGVNRWEYVDKLDGFAIHLGYSFENLLCLIKYRRFYPRDKNQSVELIFPTVDLKKVELLELSFIYTIQVFDRRLKKK